MLRAFSSAPVNVSKSETRCRTDHTRTLRADLFLGNPIVLDGDQLVDAHDASASNHEKPTLEVADLAAPSG